MTTVAPGVIRYLSKALDTVSDLWAPRIVRAMMTEANSISYRLAIA